MYNEVSIINNTLNGTWKTRLIIYAVCLLEKRKFEIDSENNCFLWSKHHLFIWPISIFIQILITVKVISRE